MTRPDPKWKNVYASVRRRSAPGSTHEFWTFRVEVDHCLVSSSRPIDFLNTPGAHKDIFQRLIDQADDILNTPWQACSEENFE